MGDNGHPLGNQYAGVQIDASATDPVVGGSTSTTGVCNRACNIISGNAGSGVVIGNTSTDASQATISCNRIFGNLTGGVSGGAEIQLTVQSPTACATTSAPGVPNQYLPCPKVGVPSNDSVTVKTCAGCTVELFQASPGPNDQNSGGATAYLGSQTDTSTPVCSTPPCTNIGSVTFSKIPGDITLTATATNAAGTETSEFAQDSSGPTVTRVDRLTMSHHGSLLILHWRLATVSGVAGFNIYAAGHRLNRRLIPVNRTPSHTFQVRTGLPGPYRLHVMLSNGSEETVPVA